MDTRDLSRAALAGALALVAALGGAQAASAQSRALQSIKTVVIDPGHGGHNDGAQGHRGSVEKDLALAVAYAARDQLRRDYPDLRVVLTRNLDIDLSLPDRIHTAHMAEADLFLSLHMNSSTNLEAEGVEVFYLSTDKSMPMVTRGEGTWGQAFEDPDEGVPSGAMRHGTSGDALPRILLDLERARSHADSAVLAETLLEELRRACGGCRNRGVRQANFGVLRGSLVPSAVVEFGFISHPTEERRLIRDETHKRFAKAISRTVERMDAIFAAHEY